MKTLMMMNGMKKMMETSFPSKAWSERTLVRFQLSTTFVFLQSLSISSVCCSRNTFKACLNVVVSRGTTKRAYGGTVLKQLRIELHRPTSVHGQVAQMITVYSSATCTGIVS